MKSSREQGAEAILLGGADLNLVFGDAVLDFPVIDSALAHVDAIVATALGESNQLEALQ